MKFYLAIALVGLTEAIKLRGDDEKPKLKLPNDPMTMPVWALRSVNGHQANINDQKGYAAYSTEASNKCTKTWLDFGTNEGKE